MDTPFDAKDLAAHGVWMRALARDLVGEDRADDAVQEAWLAAVRGAPAERRALAPWLARVVRNSALRARRTDVRRADRHASAPEREPVETPDETLQRLELSRRLVEAVTGLSEPGRTAVVQRYLEGRTSADIARNLGVQPGTVRWRLKQALDELRRCLDDEHGDRAAWCALLAPFAHPPALQTALRLTPSATPLAAKGALTMAATSKFLAWGASLAACAFAGAAWWMGTRRVEPPASPPAPSVAQVAEGGGERSDAVPSSAHARVAATPATEGDPAAPPPRTDVAAPPAAPPGELAVRFVDELGVPWEGVLLEQRAHRPSADVALSDADGDAVLTVPMSAGLSARQVELRASREGCATLRFAATVKSGERTSLGDRVLRPGASIFGRVVDADGMALAGARVGVASFDEPAPGSARDRQVRLSGATPFFEHDETRSEADGSFTLDGVPPGNWRVWAAEPDHRFGWTEPLAIVPGDAFGPTTVALEPLRADDRIEGRVFGPDGEPVGQGSLLVSWDGPDGSGMEIGDVHEDGRFRVLARHAGQYGLTATDPFERYPDAHLDGVLPGTLDVVLQFREPQWIELVVRDRDGAPIDDYRVSTHDEQGAFGDRPRLDHGDGTARMMVPDARFFLEVESPDTYANRLGPLDPQALGERLVVTLERAPRLRGTVHAGGAPVQGARVVVQRRVPEGSVLVNDLPLRMSSFPSAQTTTDAAGAFDVGLPEVGTAEVYVRVLSDGWATAERGPLTVAAACAREIAIALDRGGVLEGLVTSPDGRDTEGTIVALNFGDGDGRSLRAGPGGAFRVERLTAGPWQVRVSEVEVRHDATSYSSGGAAPIEWNCTLDAGRTTRLELEVPGAAGR